MKVTRQITKDLSNTYGGGNPTTTSPSTRPRTPTTVRTLRPTQTCRATGTRATLPGTTRVDDHSAYQSFEDDIQCWHAGDGQGTGNLKSIAIEICVNKDGNFTQACENAASLTADLMDKYNIPMENVVPAQPLVRQELPHVLAQRLQGHRLGGLQGIVKAHGAGSSKPPQPPMGDIDVDGYWGNDTTFALQKAIGTPEDGFISQQPSQHKSKNPGLTNGWEWTTTRPTAARPSFARCRRSSRRRAATPTRLTGSLRTQHHQGFAEALRHPGRRHTSPRRRPS